ncbi:hypothetical protein AC579_7785 [Pseudocercospora musae]|uniref:Uncharacterized protein n=1 Tax=Pseudocercospora musae TaxID=113226 RepID=A0A139IJK8_9PEZI|nr:hypothetical protein AC579_7785 [Pseudocercospora musae]
MAHKVNCSIKLYSKPYCDESPGLGRLYNFDYLESVYRNDTILDRSDSVAMTDRHGHGNSDSNNDDDHVHGGHSDGHAELSSATTLHHSAARSWPANSKRRLGQREIAKPVELVLNLSKITSNWSLVVQVNL